MKTSFVPLSFGPPSLPPSLRRSGRRSLKRVEASRRTCTGKIFFSSLSSRLLSLRGSLFCAIFDFAPSSRGRTARCRMVPPLVQPTSPTNCDVSNCAGQQSDKRLTVMRLPPREISTLPTARARTIIEIIPPCWPNRWSACTRTTAAIGNATVTVSRWAPEDYAPATLTFTPTVCGRAAGHASSN